MTQGAAGAIEAAKFLTGRGVPSQAIVLPGSHALPGVFKRGIRDRIESRRGLVPEVSGVGIQGRRRSGHRGDHSSYRGTGCGSPAAASRTRRHVLQRRREVVREGVLAPPDFRRAATRLQSSSRRTPATRPRTWSRKPLALAQRGLVAVAIDYRGWGKSGAFIYLAEPVRWDDRLRFSQHTAKVRLRRGRLIPEAQVIDIRNAITYIQGEPGVDATRIGVIGIRPGRLARRGGRRERRARESRRGHRCHRSRQGRGTRVVCADAALQASMVKLARTGQAPATEAAATAMNAGRTEDRARGVPAVPLHRSDSEGHGDAVSRWQGGCDHCGGGLPREEPNENAMSSASSPAPMATTMNWRPRCR